MEIPMPNATVGADAQVLPEATINPDAELISDVAELSKHSDVIMVIREPKKGVYDKVLPVETY
jgi:hypothetical protein